MKNYLILLVFLIICINSKAQNQIIGNLKDEKTQKNIPFATITFTNRNLGTYSDENGNFKLDAQQTDSLIQISSIGYQSKILNANNIPISIYLNPISEDLEEIVISKAKPNYKNRYILAYRKPNLKLKKSSTIGYEFCAFLENTYNKNGIIKNVILSFNKKDEYDYIPSYSIKFYEFDSIKKEPGELIFFENVIVKPENKTYKLKVDVEKLNIPLPKNGVCIGVESFLIKDKKLKSMHTIAPWVNYTLSKKENLSWTRFMSKKWYAKGRDVTTKKEYYKNPYIHITAKIE